MVEKSDQITRAGDTITSVKLMQTYVKPVGLLIISTLMRLYPF